MAAILKIYILLRMADWIEAWLEASGWLVDQK